ncbi:MAG TPA: hypothetical protein PKB10_08240 [Tepidisphaeraceae bacterium]|nr:hypothetical protein [Tepidisphaeraceae bacterium]
MTTASRSSCSSSLRAAAATCAGSRAGRPVARSVSGRFSAAVLAVVVQPGRIDQHRQPPPARLGDDRLADRGGEDAFVVVLERDDIAPVHRGDGAFDELLLGVGIDGRAVLDVQADHLLGGAILAAAEQPDLFDGGTPGEREQAGDIAPHLLGGGAQIRAGAIVTHHTQADHARAQFRQPGKHKPRPAEALLFSTEAQYGDGRFGADAVGAAKPIAVEHEISREQHARGLERLGNLDQTGGHT